MLKCILERKKRKIKLSATINKFSFLHKYDLIYYKEVRTNVNACTDQEHFIIYVLYNPRPMECTLAYLGPRECTITNPGPRDCTFTNPGPRESTITNTEPRECTLTHPKYLKQLLTLF